jgi:hypothetical protein
MPHDQSITSVCSSNNDAEIRERTSKLVIATWVVFCAREWLAAACGHGFSVHLH